MQNFPEQYQKKYGVVHDREIQFYPEANKIIGKDSGPVIEKKQPEEEQNQ